MYTEHTELKIFSLFRTFEQLALPLNNRVSLEIFHCIEYISYHSGFFSNFALTLKSRAYPGIFHCIE